MSDRPVRGDTVAALAAAGVEDQLTYVSTAAGAFLEWLEGKELWRRSLIKPNPAKAGTHLTAS